MRFLLGVFIFLSSSAIWSKTYIICDTPYTFFPDYEKRWSLIISKEDGKETIPFITYSEYSNNFSSMDMEVWISPLQISNSWWKLDRLTGKMNYKSWADEFKNYDRSKEERTCKKHDRASWNKEKSKEQKFIENKEKKRKL